MKIEFNNKFSLGETSPLCFGQLYIYSNHHHAQQNLPIFRLIVFAFQLGHQQTYTISKAIQKLIPLCAIEISFIPLQYTVKSC